MVNRYQYEQDASGSNKGRELAPLEFELVDFNAARDALAEPPPGVKPPKPIVWEQRRRALSPAEMNCSLQGSQWLMRLPDDLRPITTALRFARVVNHIAEAWADPQRCLAVLDDLIVDRRGGRKGFPEAVTAELNRLRDDRLAAAGQA